MGWAKYEEDNREARTERYSSGNYFWTPYTSQETYKANSYKPVVTYLPQAKPAPKKKRSYAYGY